MITNVYFVRHAQSDSSVKDEFSRPLTDKGIEDAKYIIHTLADKSITAVYSSPYIRAVDTIRGFAESAKLQIVLNESFCEHKIGDLAEEYKIHSRMQWSDYDYKLPNGESFREVQSRNISALFDVVAENMGKSLAIGTHGFALSTIINYFKPEFGHDDFWSIIDKMPFIVCFRFEDKEFLGMEEIELIKCTL